MVRTRIHVSVFVYIQSDVLTHLALTVLLSEKEQKLVEDPDRLMKLRRQLEQQINVCVIKQSSLERH